MSEPAARPGCTGGLFEVLVGVPDLAAAELAFRAYGCRAGERGALDAAAARALYGVDSEVESVRLLHGTADHGQVRLMQWRTPRNEGLGLGQNLRCAGSRWGVRLTTSMFDVLNHAERARDAGEPIVIIDPALAVITEVTGAQVSRPFVDPIVGVREMVMIQPTARHVFFQRFGYESALYGSVDPASLLRTSQHTHFGLMIADDDPHVLDFYAEVLGLKRTFDEATPYEKTSASRRIFGLAPGEGFHMVDFDDPRTGTALAERRSGKLKCVRFPRSAQLDDLRERSRAGSLGYTSYVWRAPDIEGLWKRVGAEGGREVTDVLPDEFGVPGFSFLAPDGYHWILRKA
jgi:catechol 2,3-dioxygenase-like lactoylglutathione lyase family enzyme